MKRTYLGGVRDYSPVVTSYRSKREEQEAYEDEHGEPVQSVPYRPAATWSDRAVFRLLTDIRGPSPVPKH